MDAANKEILNHLIQEAGEVIVACTKLIHFGGVAVDSYTGIIYDNTKDLGIECGQLAYMVNLLLEHNLIKSADFDIGYNGKQVNFLRYSRCNDQRTNQEK